MRAYIIRRLLILIPTLIVVSLLIFFLTELIPGNIIDAMLASPGAEEIDREAVALKLGLDAPLLVQYGRWMGIAPQVDGSFSGILQGDFGISWRLGIPVVKLLATTWPVTIQLGLMGLITAQLIALPVGIYSAIRQDSWGDYIGRSFAILCISLPGFWLATLIIVFPSIWWRYMPPIMFIPFTEDPIGNLKMVIVPAMVLGMALCGLTMRMTRAMMLEVLRQDYIRTAWAKGLRERVVIIRHTLRNALIPVITQQGLWVPFLLGGTIIIETIFVLPGMGTLIVTATRYRDYPILSGALLSFGGAIVLVNLMIDLTYGFLDPRVHYK